MAKYYSGIETGTTLDSMLASGSDFGIFPSQNIDCQDIDCRDVTAGNVNVTGIHTVGGFFYPNGGIKDSSNSTGSSGKVLSSTGSGLAWIDPSQGSTANAVNVGTNLDSTNSDQFVAFVGSSSGNNPIRVDTDIKYNPNTNTLSVKGITLPGDDQKISIGADNPLEIQHSATSSQVEIKSDANISIMSGDRVQIENESGGNIADFIKASGCELYHNVSGTQTLRLKTTTTGATVTGIMTATSFSGDVTLASNQNLKVGTGLTAFFNGTSVQYSNKSNVFHTIENSGQRESWSSKLIVGENTIFVPQFRIYHNSAVEMYYANGGKRLSTSGIGVTVYDQLDTTNVSAGSSITAATFYGSGVNLTSVTAAKVTVTDESTDTTCHPLFATTNTGNAEVKVGSNLSFNSSTGALSATSFSGSIAASNINSGTLGTDRIPDLAASKITSGTLGTARIPSLAASKITSGTLGTARIPNLAASKITSGTLGTARIPDLAASKITSGQFDTARIPTLNQNTTGTSGGLAGSPSITVTNITIDGQLKDGDGVFGSSGTVLTSDGTDTKWDNVGNLAAGSAALVAVNATNSTNSSHFIAFTETSSGNEEIRVDNSLTYNPSTNVLTAGSFSGSVAASNVDSGTLGTDRIPDLAASKITSGTLGTDRIPDLAASKITSGTLGTARIPSLAASKITSGTLGTARIPDLAASKITSGTLGTDRIPSLAASKITSGQFDAARIPTLNQDTTGTADKAETAKITTDNSDAIRPILFIASSGNNNAAVNNTFAPLRFSPTIYSLSYNPTSEKFYVNHAQFSGNIVAYGTGRVGDTFTVKGSEGTDAIIELNADEGDDNEDKWRIRSDATGNNLKFESYYSGSWSDGSPLQLAGNGIVTMPGQAVIDKVNINENVIQLNSGTEDLKIRGNGTGGANHLTLDDDVTIVGDLTVQGSSSGTSGTTVKHVRQTSNVEMPTGNTSYGVAGSMQLSITAPSNNCLLFYAYNFSLQQGGTGGGQGVSYRGRVFVNGSHSHNFIGQSEGGNQTANLSATFQNEGYGASTLYSANDTITVQFEIRNRDTGTGNKTRLNAGAFLTVFAFATS